MGEGSLGRELRISLPKGSRGPGAAFSADMRQSFANPSAQLEDDLAQQKAELKRLLGEWITNKRALPSSGRVNFSSQPELDQSESDQPKSGQNGQVKPFISQIEVKQSEVGRSWIVYLGDPTILGQGVGSASLTVDPDTGNILKVTNISPEGSSIQTDAKEVSNLDTIYDALLNFLNQTSSQKIKD